MATTEYKIYNHGGKYIISYYTSRVAYYMAMKYGYIVKEVNPFLPRRGRK